MTQLEAAKQGIITEEMRQVAEDEHIDAEKIREGVEAGHIVIPANKNHRSLHAYGIGEGLRTKMNVNLGVSKDCHDYSVEQEKARLAWRMKAEAIMDLSCYGKTAGFRHWLIENSPAAIGTVPMYDVDGALGKALKDMTADDLFQVVEQHAKDGVDFMTIHAGINREVAGHVMRNKRITNLVSRGGSILFAWMMIKGKENPFYEQYDRLLDICRTYDVTISLGDACRSGCGHDSTDAIQIAELITLGELVVRARKAGVQVMVEGPGHMPLNDIRMNVEVAKKLCHGAPLYVLGPIVTDVAPGYDHITAAIGGTLSAACGADFLCYVTPAEHLRLPDIQDVHEGIVASKIACHAADIVKKVPGAAQWDEEMSWARRRVDFKRMIPLAIDPEKAKAYRESSQPEEEQTCTMCGPKCPMKTLDSILNNRNTDEDPYLK
ncbi:phosphomethylpyrimidine synthase ThiC [Allisonella histaminiformans]|uniref:phosphomethylpyrimidine synthase ThiC n=2 Tax=Allisonella histaminiformans TaxID=209880 RepID=UPI0022E3A821|nr:phosphomethylpyrimidine synthase ThiC [Allisonella histaminiformans]MCI6003899.1 phosphomethylpyrimidine synthase ThiC [Allisonella histaminiformans]MDY3956767.1 phosphomethylpyrimidine synthase ThiC [Allisonella histaminiformans]